MARRYRRDARGRFASTGGSSIPADVRAEDRARDMGWKPTNQRAAQQNLTERLRRLEMMDPDIPGGYRRR